MKRVFKVIIVLAAALTIAGCSKNLEINQTNLEGSWNFVLADEAVSSDGSVEYTFLTDGTCLVKACNYLASREDATHYSVTSWLLSGNLLSIGTDGGNVYSLSSKSRNKILCKSNRDGTEYLLCREKGTDYKAVMGGIWFGEKKVTTVTGDGVESEQTGVWSLSFQEGRKCSMTTALKGMLSANKVDYLCFWSPEGASFSLVDSDMNWVYYGCLKNGKISMHRFLDTEIIELSRLLTE